MLNIYQKILNVNREATANSESKFESDFDRIKPLKEIKNSIRVDRRNRRRNENIKVEENEVNGGEISPVTEYTVEDATTLTVEDSENKEVNADENSDKLDEAKSTNENTNIQLTTQKTDNKEPAVTSRTLTDEETIFTDVAVTETESSLIENTEPEIIVGDSLNDFPSYDIQVGASIFSGPSNNEDTIVGIGESEPVDLKAEHKTPDLETELTPETTDESDSESPSLLSAIFNILARPERPTRRPRPTVDRLNSSRPSVNRIHSKLNRTRPSRPPPFRKRPERPFFTPNNRPNKKKIKTPTGTKVIEDDQTLPKDGSIVSTSFNVVSKSEDNERPQPLKVPSDDSPFTLLPSEPVIENGFLAMKDGENKVLTDENIESNNENEDGSSNVKPTLPPSLPNLK